MEKWAQSQNKKKEVIKKPVTSTLPNPIKAEPNGKLIAVIKEVTSANESNPNTTTVNSNGSMLYEQMSTPSDEAATAAKKVLIKVTVIHESNTPIIMYLNNTNLKTVYIVFIWKSQSADSSQLW